MTITSTGFQMNDTIPQEYTCDGSNINPPLTFSEISENCQALVLIVDDPDAPNGLFTHWLLYDMSPATLQILEGQTPETGQEGMNDFPALGYGGPCPPEGPHRYFFRLYALNEPLGLPAGANRQEVDKAMKGKVIDSTELMGLYERTPGNTVTA